MLVAAEFNCGIVTSIYVKDLTLENSLSPTLVSVAQVLVCFGLDWTQPDSVLTHSLCFI